MISKKRFKQYEKIVKKYFKEEIGISEKKIIIFGYLCNHEDNLEEFDKYLKITFQLLKEIKGE